MLDDIKLKQLSLELVEKILMEKEYNSKQEVMLNVLTKYKSLTENTSTKKALKLTINHLNSLSFDEMKELIILFKNHKF